MLQQGYHFVVPLTPGFLNCRLPQVWVGAILQQNAYRFEVAVLGRPVERGVVTRFQGIGIGMPGPADYARGIISKTPNLSLRNLNIKKPLQKAFHVPVTCENDANCFALAEAVLGAGKGKSTVVGITLGSGFGSGIIINKKIFHGKGNAGEFGHTTLCFHGPRCRCGNIGCIEEYCSARGVLRLAKGMKAHTPLEVHNLAEKGNKQARAVFLKYGFYLGTGLVNIIHSLDPDSIVIGGGISGAYKYFQSSMKETVQKKCILTPPRISRSLFGKQAGVIGAALLTSLT